MPVAHSPSREVYPGAAVSSGNNGSTSAVGDTTVTTTGRRNGGGSSVAAVGTTGSTTSPSPTHSYPSSASSSAASLSALLAGLPPPPPPPTSATLLRLGWLGGGARLEHVVRRHLLTAGPGSSSRDARRRAATGGRAFVTALVAAAGRIAALVAGAATSLPPMAALHLYEELYAGAEALSCPLPDFVGDGMTFAALEALPRRLFVQYLARGVLRPTDAGLIAVVAHVRQAAATGTAVARGGLSDSEFIAFLLGRCSATLGGDAVHYSALLHGDEESRARTLLLAQGGAANVHASARVLDFDALPADSLEAQHAWFLPLTGAARLLHLPATAEPPLWRDGTSAEEVLSTVRQALDDLVLGDLERSRTHSSKPTGPRPAMPKKSGSA